MVGPTLAISNVAKPDAGMLGVAVSPAPTELQAQLKLKSGLVIVFVEPNSPAFAAGVKPQDVFEKLDDQWLFEPSQLAGLLRMRKPGDRVALTIIHSGKRETVPATLAMPAPNAAAAAQIQAASGPGMQVVTATATLAPGTVIDADMVGGGADSQSGLDWEIRSRDGHCLLKIKDDKSGKVVFDGPIDTSKQRTMVPASAWSQLKMLGANIKAAMKANPPQGSEKKKLDAVLKALASEDEEQPAKP